MIAAFSSRSLQHNDFELEEEDPEPMGGDFKLNGEDFELNTNSWKTS